MDKVTLVKEDIVKLITNNFGDAISKTFLDLYRDETLPIYTDGALKILEGLIGREKAKLELGKIFIKYEMKSYL